MIKRKKHFLKWALPVRRQVKQYYIRNLVLKRRVRIMKQKLSKAWNLVRKYKEATRFPAPGNTPKPRTKPQEATPK